MRRTIQIMKHMADIHGLKRKNPTKTLNFAQIMAESVIEFIDAIIQTLSHRISLVERSEK